MKKLSICLFSMILLSGVFVQKAKAQTLPTVAEVKQFLNSKNLLISYREGGAVYGTYYFMDIHYCPSGNYWLKGKSVKQTVMGNEQHNNWQEYGTLKVVEYQGKVGVHYLNANGQQSFTPVYRQTNGRYFIGEGVSYTIQGAAVCY
ncbi:MAG: hypothetical protein HC831_19850 [Chloroflexia bacterium]|nr:hypothetical protein [Chloroflexia bacterium]